MATKVMTAIFAVTLASVPSNAVAEEVTGQVLLTQGHLNPSCRMVKLRRSDNGADMWFRIPADNSDILAITMTALVSRVRVTISFNPGVTTGCGFEPRIDWISLLSDIN